MRLHTLIDELPEDMLLGLQQALEQMEEQKADPLQRQQFIARIIAEDAALLKRLGR